MLRTPQSLLGHIQGSRSYERVFIYPLYRYTEIDKDMR
jgi:hypothetical protein